MEPLKNTYNTTFFKLFLDSLLEIKPKLNKTEFLAKIYKSNWEIYELKQRMHHIAITLHSFLNPNFNEAITEIEQLIVVLQKKNIKGGFAYLFLPDYIETYGKDNLVKSISSFEKITLFVSCEFAIRPFLLENPKYVIAKMTEWSFHTNVHLRRLASEGCRPRLPWAMALPMFKKDPTPILPILENLINDDALYVRKSVANNLNDISKDHKEMVIAFTKKHYGETKNTNWILKHANRNLLKQGELQILSIFGYGNQTQIDIQNFKLNSPIVRLETFLEFSFNLVNNHKNPLLIRLEYAIYYLKNNGTLSKKVFQIGSKEYPNNSCSNIKKKQHFKSISTRKYNMGIHKIGIIANGKEFDILEFELRP